MDATLSTNIERQPARLLLTPEEAARAVGLSRARLYQLLADGSIPSMKVGRARRIPVSELQGWIRREIAAQSV